MNVTLREVTPENFKECVNLKVADTQASFVASNVMSLAYSRFYPTVTPMAVYAGDEMVGFVLFGLDPDDDRYYLIRLMIDERHQGRGYGKAAVERVIEKMRENPECRELYLSFVPENTGAEALYKSVGFERTGEIAEGEIVMRYDMTKEANNGRPRADN
jgi:diamine N-acetyltransferase